MNHTGSIQLFLDTCHLIHAKGLVSGSGGNISLRCDDGILITPSGRSLESLKEEDLVLLQMDGSYTCPNGGIPSKEWRMHLACYRARPDFYTDPRGRLSAAWHRLQYRRIAKKAERIITVSEFSKSEITKYYGVPASEIEVVYNAWQQMERITPDDSIFAAYPQLKAGAYYFSMANLLKNKNFPWVLRAAKARPDAVFAIAGGGSLAAQAERLGLANLPNVLYLGYVSDGAAKALMARCRAFLFPTLYEGFGIPPLEAAACGAPEIIVSDTPCMREVYGPSAAYIDLAVNHGDVDSITPAQAPAAAVLARYSWDRSAEKLLQILTA